MENIDYIVKSLNQKIIEDKYEKKLSKILDELKNSPKSKEIFDRKCAWFFAIQMNLFVKTMISIIFNKNNGVFKDSIEGLNNINFDKLYYEMSIWFSWKRIPVKSDHKDYEECMANNFNSLENYLSINKEYIEYYYSNLNQIPDSLIEYSLYRWCMLDINHLDKENELLHENSSDCKKFKQAVEQSIKEVDVFVRSSLSFLMN